MRTLLTGLGSVVVILMSSVQAQAFICRPEGGAVVQGLRWPSKPITGDVRVSGVPANDEAAVLNGAWSGCTILPRFDETPMNLTVVDCKSLGGTASGTVDMTYYPDASRVVLTHFKPDGSYVTKEFSGGCLGRELDHY